MPVRTNSALAKEAIKETAATRRQIILHVFRKRGLPLTDREIMEYLGWHDMNMVRPRITELLEAGYLTEVCHAKCHRTNKRVRMCMARGL